MDNWWYYNFSTIAQVCAGLIGFLGAVFVYKMTTLGKEINDFQSRFIKTFLVPISGHDETEYYFKDAWTLISEYQQNKAAFFQETRINDAVIRAIDENYKVATSHYSWLKNTLTTFAALSISRKNASKQLVIVLIILFAPIFTSIVGLFTVSPNDGYSIINTMFSLACISFSGFFGYKLLSQDVFDLKVKFKQFSPLKLSKDFSKQENIMNIRFLLKAIVESAEQLKIRHGLMTKQRVNYACIFCQNDLEYEQFFAAASAFGKVVKETPTGQLFQVEPIETSAGKLQLVKVRKPDPTRPERGDADFTVADYEAFKKEYTGKLGFKLIENRADIEEMIELMDPAFNVRAYFSKVPLDKVFGLV